MKHGREADKPVCLFSTKGDLQIALQYALPGRIACVTLK